MGEKESVATAEAKQEPGLRGFDEEPAVPSVIFFVDVSVSAVLDVTRPDVQVALGTNEKELLANWRTISDAPTQILGNAVYNSGRFEGIRYRSAAAEKESKEGYCLVLFRDRKLASSKVLIYDDSNIFSEEW